jgi:hypothetical protein
MRWVIPREERRSTLCLLRLRGTSTVSSVSISSALLFPFDLADALAFCAFKTEAIVCVERDSESASISASASAAEMSKCVFADPRKHAQAERNLERLFSSLTFPHASCPSLPAFRGFWWVRFKAKHIRLGDAEGTRLYNRSGHAPLRGKRSFMMWQHFGRPCTVPLFYCTPSSLQCTRLPSLNALCILKTVVFALIRGVSSSFMFCDSGTPVTRP